MAKLIVVEGLDGSGKATQSKILAERLEGEGYKVHLISFPNYKSDSSGPIKMYLSGEIDTDLKSVNPYGGSTLYAIDRYITYKKELKDLFEDDKAIIIADRYVSSNIIHQASKIECEDELKEYYNWIYDLEYVKFGIPKEDLLIYLDVPIDKSQELMNERYNKEGGCKDIHESNLEYLNNCRETAHKASTYFYSIGEQWDFIDCIDIKSGDMREISCIADEVYKLAMEVIKA